MRRYGVYHCVVLGYTIKTAAAIFDVIPRPQLVRNLKKITLKRSEVLVTYVPTLDNGRSRYIGEVQYEYQRSSASVSMQVDLKFRKTRNSTGLPIQFWPSCHHRGGYIQFAGIVGMLLPKIEPPYPRTMGRGGLDSLFSPLLVLVFAIKLCASQTLSNI